MTSVRNVSKYLTFTVTPIIRWVSLFGGTDSVFYQTSMVRVGGVGMGGGGGLGHGQTAKSWILTYLDNKRVHGIQVRGMGAA